MLTNCPFWSSNYVSAITSIQKRKDERENLSNFAHWLVKMDIFYGTPIYGEMD